ncbi:MAG: aminopeptidase [Cytophagales bacterium]|nr:MAG: aminopeptidase [Cytophagales bacterium]
MNTAIPVKIRFWSLALGLILGCRSQPIAPVLPKSSYAFTTVSELPCLPVEDQYKSGTCWAFTMASFLESEIIRQSGRRIDLSEMHLVRNTYFDKAEAHLMRHGQLKFPLGGLNPDPINTAIQYGLVPNQAYTGLVNGATQHDHMEMHAKIEKIMARYVSNSVQSNGWRAELTATMDRHIGPDVPAFAYNGESFTPARFRDFTGLQLDQYVHLTSFTHRPFYQPMVLAVPDNFSNALFQNVPLDAYMQNLNHALDRGFTVAVELDVSEPTFSGDYGLAVIAETDADASRILLDPLPEKQVTQAYRQQEFENYHTNNDHNVHLVGRVRDQTGKVYFKAKNSWSSKWGRDGYVYLSEAYVRLKVVYFTLHQDALLPVTKQMLKL